MALLDERAGTARPSWSTAPRTYDPHVAPTQTLFDAVASAPWLTVRDTGEIIKDAVTAEPEIVPQTPGETTWHRPRSRHTPHAEPGARIPRTISQVEGVAEILPAATEFRQGWTQAQEHSVHPVARPPDRLGGGRGTEAAVALVSGGVHVEPRTINFFADEGIIQLTVVNTLAVEVHDVNLRLTVPGAEAKRLRIDGDRPPCGSPPTAAPRCSSRSPRPRPGG